jgi:hypothetical protein
MALLADNPTDRAEQMVALTERLTRLIDLENARLKDFLPPLDGADGDEKARLANLYRQELARIAEDKTLLSGAPKPIIDGLRAATTRFRASLQIHERLLIGFKEVSEGLVKAIAEEVSRLRAGPATYAATGGYAAKGAGAGALAMDRTA